MKLNKQYWNQRYLQQNTPWDVGMITTPIKDYVDQLTNKELKILIPGVGSGHELMYLYKKGFKNVYGLDISEEALKKFMAKNPAFPKEQLILEDFFTHEQSYDLILEQTFFCALDPILRPLYVQKMETLLTSKGTLAGVLFSFPFTTQGPPFGGSKEEYCKLFENNFTDIYISSCYNSIKPRKNNELFILIKKQHD